MSFSGKIKEELAGHLAKARHCNLAELSALVEMTGEFRTGGKWKMCSPYPHGKSASRKKSLYIIAKNI